VAKAKALLAVLVLAALLSACGTENEEASERADRCLQAKIYDLSSIDHEQPSEGVVRALIDFCERQFGARSSAPAVIAAPAPTPAQITTAPPKQNDKNG